LGSLDVYTLEELMNFGKKAKKQKSAELNQPSAIKE
jgi:hypothetical protein